MMGLKTPQLLFWNKPDLKGKSFLEDEPIHLYLGLETSELVFLSERRVHYAEFENL